MLPILEPLGPDLCLSGGAEGADLQWGMCCGTAGMSVVHFSFAGHATAAPSSEVVRLSPEQLAEADETCIRANRTLKRSYPPSNPFTRDLLRRNHFQVAWSKAVYAVSTLKRGEVQGGTAWAVQMFLDRHDGGPCPAYVFCQAANRWFGWRGSWQPIYKPPRPSGVFAGIGTRKLDASGKFAIRVLLGYPGKLPQSGPMGDDASDAATPS